MTQINMLLKEVLTLEQFYKNLQIPLRSVDRNKLVLTWSNQVNGFYSAMCTIVLYVVMSNYKK